MTVADFQLLVLMFVLAGAVMLLSLGFVWLIDFLFTLDVAARWVLEMLG